MSGIKHRWKVYLWASTGSSQWWYWWLLFPISKIIASRGWVELLKIVVEYEGERRNFSPRKRSTINFSYRIIKNVFMSTNKNIKIRHDNANSNSTTFDVFALRMLMILKNFDFEFVTHHNRFSHFSAFLAFLLFNKHFHSIFHDKRWEIASESSEGCSLLFAVFCWWWKSDLIFSNFFHFENFQVLLHIFHEDDVLNFHEDRVSISSS